MRILGALALVLACIGPAHAVIVQTSTGGTVTSEPGALTFADFDAIADTGIGSVSGGASNHGSAPGGGGNWLTARNGFPVIEVAFAGLTDYFGFLWGTRDVGNRVELFRGATSLGTFDRIGGGFFVGFEATTAADYFDRAVLSFDTCCFETDNYAARLVATPQRVSEPSPVLLLLGAGLLGVSRRRRGHGALARSDDLTG